MILEGLVTTRAATGEMHLAPMGPRLAPDERSFILRPFPTSQTYQNLLIHPQGVLHVVDDVLLLARAAVGKISSLPPHRAARIVSGFVLEDACRILEFEVESFDDSQQRINIPCRVMHRETLRDFWGFNRAKHAVLEAAIHCTRLHLLNLTEIRAEFDRLKIIIDKTGGDREFEAFAFLESILQQVIHQPRGDS